MNGRDERDIFREMFFDCVARCPPLPPPETWRRCCNDPWFLRELGSQARRVIGKSRAPPDLWDEVINDAMLVFFRNLDHSPNLGLEPSVTSGIFQAKISRILLNASRKAMRQLRRIYQPRLELFRDGDVRRVLANATAREPNLDLRLAIDELPEPLRRVMFFRLIGRYSKRDISRLLNISYSDVRLYVAQGLRRLGL